jgi:hypothetical protein
MVELHFNSPVRLLGAQGQLVFIHHILLGPSNEEDEVGGVCSVHGRLAVDGRIILKNILKK